MKKETKFTLKEVYEEARRQEGNLPPPEPPLPEDKRLWLADMVQKNQLSRLLNEFHRAKVLALKNPGEQLQGNVILGAPPEYYSPSAEELVLAALGHSIERTLQSLCSIDDVRKVCADLLADEEPPLIVDYLYYPYEKVDVVGSGRFYYPLEPVECRVDVLKELLAHLPTGEMMWTSSNDKSKRLQVLGQLMTLLG